MSVCSEVKHHAHTNTHTHARSVVLFNFYQFYYKFNKMFKHFFYSFLK